MTPAQNREFQSLVEASLTGSLSPEEHDLLESLLRESPQCRTAWLDAAGMHLDLTGLARRQPLEGQPIKRQPIERQRALNPDLPAQSSRRVVGWTIAAIGAGLALVFFTMFRQASVQHRAEERPVAATETIIEKLPPIIAESTQAKLFGHGMEPELGTGLEMNREYVLTHGQLALQFATGARVVLTAPAVFSPDGTESLLVSSGECSVHVPPGAEGFVVRTPSAEIVDLGTRFVLDVAMTGETDLLVVEGAATLAAKDRPAGDPILLHEGESARVEPDQLPETPSPSAGSLHFLETLPDRVVRYEATRTPEGFADELLSVIVQRDGRNIEYQREDLIGTRLTHYSSRRDWATFTTRLGEPLPEGEARLALLDGDWSLVTGIVNPTVQPGEHDPEALQPVMAVEFRSPVVNGPGPDILLFDLQLLVSREEGEIVRLMSGDDRENPPVLKIDRFDIMLTSPYALNLAPHHTHRALQPTRSLDDLVHSTFQHGRQTHINAKGIVAGIDLTDLGYAPGETLRRLVLLHTEDRNRIDPVLIVGLPPLPAK